MRGTWKNSTVLLLGMTLGAAGLWAQSAQPAPDAASQSAATTSATRGEHNKLGLTQEQRKQMRELRMSARDQAAIIRNDQTLSAEQKQAKLKDLRASTRDKMKAVLTPEQQTQIANMRSEHQAKMAAKLGLAPDQQSKLKELFASHRQQRESILTNTSLSNDQKATQLSQLRQSSKAQLATILTPEQLVKFQQMRRGRRHHMHMQN